MFGPATCLPDMCFCEAIRPFGLMQPSNAYSSLFLVLVALIVLWSGRHGWFGYAFAGALTIAGLGSFWYHADLTLLTQTFDNLGMYFVVLLPITLLFVRRYSWTKSRAVLFFVGISLSSLGVILLYHGARRYEFVVLILILLFFEFRWNNSQIGGSRRYLYTALGIFAAAAVIWIFDITGLWCVPASVWQGHALWHILNGIAAYYLYLHYQKISVGVE